MAEIFPAQPFGALPHEVLRVFRVLKGLPDGCRVWHRLAPWQKDAPDFLLRSAHGQALLLAVSTAGPRDARPAAQLQLLDPGRPPLGAQEAAVLDRFTAALAGPLRISPAIVFPNIPQAALDAARPAGQQAPLWLGQEFLSGSNPAAWETAFPAEALADEAFEQLRARFCPELVVPAALTVRAVTQRRRAAGLADFLLDYDQEAALKADLDFPEQAAGLSVDLRVNVVNGVAGSGKSLILLHRLRLLHGLFPTRRFLVLTHNRPLLAELKARFARLNGGLPGNVEWRTFNSWCRSHWPAKVSWASPLGDRQRMALITGLLHELAPDLPISAGQLRSEIDWLKDSLVFDRQGYMAADRRGRGFRLTAEQRGRVFDLLMAYERRLDARGRADWGEVPRRMRRFLIDGSLEVQLYDVILVDEAQFFAPLWFDLIRRLLTPRSGHLFIVADPAQGFLGRGASWKSLGLDVRGHSWRLQKSYRTTTEILSFATLFYRQRFTSDGDEDDVVQPDFTDLPSGLVPQLLQLTSSQDEIARVANEVAAFAREGLPLRHLLVLHADWRGVKALVRAICHRLGDGAAADPKDRADGEYVRVTTLNAGAGLESPIVFLVGLNRLFELEQSLRLSDEEREELVRENTRKLYMAATRAGQRLVLTYVGALDGVVEGLLG